MLESLALLEQIGEGGMAQVWRARHTEHGYEVALKLIIQEALTPRHLELFRREVHASARLEHPNIITLLDYGQIGVKGAEALQRPDLLGYPFLVHELAVGPTLRTLARAEGMAYPQILDALLDILDALAHAHARGVIHRDLKTSNVLYDERPEQRRFKLLDFGVARAITEYASGGDEERITGTPYYMAPEQIMGRWRDEGPWTDLYALGCMAWHLLCHRRPFEGDVLTIFKGHCFGALPPFEPVVEAPPRLGKWLARLLAKDPRARFRTAAEAARHLLGGDTRHGHTLGITLRASDEVPLVDGREQDQTRRREEARAPTQELDAAARAATQRIPDWRLARRASARKIGLGLRLHGLRPPALVGREQLRDALWRALRDVIQHRSPQAIILDGPSGVGKTRVVEWMGQRAHELGLVTRLEVSHHSRDTMQNGVYRALALHLRCHGLERADVLERVKEWWGIVALERPALALGLAELLWPFCATGVDAGEELDEDTTEPLIQFSSQRERIEVLTRALQHMTRAEPLWLQIDDAQWGPDALALCLHLLRGKHDLPILLTITTSSEELAQRPDTAYQIDALREVGAMSCALGPLDGPTMASLLDAYLPLARSLSEPILERAQGNPMIALQTLGALIERGSLHTTREGFALRPGATLALPVDIARLWRERLTRSLSEVPPEERHDTVQAVSLAIALGSTFSLADWSAACAMEQIEVPWRFYAYLQRNDLLRSSEDGAWCWVPPVVHESAAQLMSGGAMQRAHLVCASTLRTRYHANHPGIRPRIAEHLACAGELDASVEVWREATEDALARVRWERDMTTLARVLDGYEHAIGRVALPVNHTHFGLARYGRAISLFYNGEVTDSERHFLALMDSARAYRWTRVLTPSLVACAVLRYRKGEREEARALIDEASREWRHLPDETERGNMACRMGELYSSLRQDREALRWLERAVELAPPGSPLEVRARLALGSAHFHAHRWSRARSMLTRAVELARTRNLPLLAANALNFLGELALRDDRLEDVLAIHQEAFRLYATVQNTPLSITLNVVVGHLLLGNWDEAQALLNSIDRDMDPGRLSGYLVYLDAFAAILRAVDGRWHKHDACIERLRRHRDRKHLHADDLAMVLERAGQLARAAGHAHRARFFLEWAAEMYATVDRPRRRAALLTQLDQLPTRSG